MTRARPLAVYLQESLPGSIEYPICRPAKLFLSMGYETQVVTLSAEQGWDGVKVWEERSKVAALRRVAALRPNALFAEGGAWQLAAIPLARRAWVRSPYWPSTRSVRAAHVALLRRAAAVSLCNPWDRGRWPLPARTLRDLPYPVDIPFWSQRVERDPSFWQRHGMPAPEGPVVVSIGQIMRRKGQLGIVEALIPMIRESALTLVLAGWTFEPDEEAAIRELVARERLQDRVLLPGSVSPIEELRQLLAWCDVQVLNTSWESQCMALYEALAAGVPTVVSDIPELTSAFPHLPSQGSPDELRSSVSAVLEDRETALDQVALSANRLAWADIPNHDRGFTELFASW